MGLRIAGAELRPQRRPGDGRWPSERVQPVGQPDIQVERHAPVPKLADCCLAQRNRVVPQGAPEGFVEDDTVLPQAVLLTLRCPEPQPAGDDAAAGPAARVLALPEEFEGTGRNPGSLFPECPCCLAANCYSHAAEPVAQAAPQLDLTAIRPHRLGLEVEQDHAGV